MPVGGATRCPSPTPTNPHQPPPTALQDLCSTNGTLLKRRGGEEAIQLGVGAGPMRLLAGDRLVVGKTTFLLGEGPKPAEGQVRGSLTLALTCSDSFSD